MAETFSTLPESQLVRFARPVRSLQGGWIRDSYVAWTFLDGEHVRGLYGEKLKASLAYHRLLSDIEAPTFLNTPRHSWSAASDTILNGNFNYGREFMDLYERIKPHLKPLNERRQLEHGDLSGNFLCAPGLAPAIIDFSPVWAPSGFGEGIMLGDIIVWEDAAIDDIAPFKEYPEIIELAWWGVLRRIAEQAEHIKWLGKDRRDAVEEAKAFQKAIDLLNKLT